MVKAANIRKKQEEKKRAELPRRKFKISNLKKPKMPKIQTPKETKAKKEVGPVVLPPYRWEGSLFDMFRKIKNLADEGAPNPLIKSVRKKNRIAHTESDRSPKGLLSSKASAILPLSMIS